MRCLQNALFADPLCFEAFEHLVGGQMLTPSDEQALLSQLALPPGAAWVAQMYSLKSACRDPRSDVPQQLAQLAASAERCGAPPGGAQALPHSADAQAAAAEWLLARGDAAGAYRSTSALLAADSLRPSVLPVHLSAAASLGKRNELFARAHALVKSDPGGGLAWYAVGLYYHCAGQFSAARRYLAKCTQLAPSFAPGWLAYGHAFAAGGEGEQALAVYRTAARLFQGAPAPLLWMGVEYAKAANWALARQFLGAARDAAPGEAQPLHELGCLALRCGDAPRAEKCFRDALQLLPVPLGSAWEPLMLGLGHALRKQRRFDEAAAAYDEALRLLPRSAVTLASLAFTRQLQGDCREAVTLYHAALGIRPDDAFSAEMLDVCLHDTYVT